MLLLLLSTLWVFLIGDGDSTTWAMIGSSQGLYWQKARIRSWVGSWSLLLCCEALNHLTTRPNVCPHNSSFFIYGTSHILLVIPAISLSSFYCSPILSPFRLLSLPRPLQWQTTSLEETLSLSTTTLPSLSLSCFKSALRGSSQVEPSQSSPRCGCYLTCRSLYLVAGVCL